jgi:monoterpene epsilon-lactone hydrolase
LGAKDKTTVAAIHAQAAPFKGGMLNVGARAAYDTMIESTAPALGVQYEEATIANVPGVWCRPAAAPSDTAILYLHGGAYILGSAHAYRHFAGQLAARSMTNTFIVDYPLAPEHPFPAGLDAAHAAYSALISQGYRKIILAGDSAGGGLALALMGAVQEQVRLDQQTPPMACVVMSPWTDLTLSGASYTERTEDEPFLTTTALDLAAQAYLGAEYRSNPRASPLLSDLSGLPPIQIHVGTAEILLSDSCDYAERAHTAGVEIALHIWQGMPHVFPKSVGVFDAAEASLNIMADFISNTFNS